MEGTFKVYILLIVIILLLIMLAQRLRVAYPVILVLGGLFLSLVPAIPEISIDPELIFVLFLPPLLYEAAWYTSWKDLWKWRRVIGSFAFLIVIITSFVVALISSTFIPGFTMALGFLLGGIVSPPDAVSASAILKYIKVPRRLTSILEGESLLNDAASLIIFRFALIAVDTGRFVFHQAALSFVVVIVMGVATGLLIAIGYYQLHKRLPTNVNIDIVLTLTTPYVMYLTAEWFHFSGVLAVVSGGLFLSYRSRRFLSHSSRLRGSTVWSSLGFVLNGLVFMLIGLELPVVVKELGTVSLKAAIGYSLLISLVLIAGRLLSTLGASAFTVFISRYITTADAHPGWKGPMILGWTGMRGVVSLAAALSIPYHLNNGTPFPQRNLILFITFSVILVTLILQGLTLPLVIKWINMEDPDHSLPLPEQEIRLRKILGQKSLAFLDGEHGDTVNHDSILQLLREKYKSEETLTSPPEHTEGPVHYRLQLQLLEQQRNWLEELNNGTDTDDGLIRKYQELLDLEEEKLRLRYEQDA
ncbi:Na+/H+ antiporter [Chitinophaga pendula]|uniref:Na+/H+ antiporter n=1 Tax=Chitinophaga pendula TaxID=2849666 RepID=UPI001CEDD104|nr:Na+/H+ antiporter [Chitinophaga pendula]UCJ05300.1 Na+/H+ antiporter [Chitinophaga pendula]